MNELEATRAKLKCLEMVEGTELHWWAVIRLNGRNFQNKVEFDGIGMYTFALGVVEGKPVWEDSRIFAHGIPVRIKQAFGDRYILIDGTRIDKDVLTWNPPKPTTLMVELPIDVAKYHANLQFFTAQQIESGRVVLSHACARVLEQLK